MRRHRPALNSRLYGVFPATLPTPFGRFEPNFSDSWEHIEVGGRWVVDMDLEKFFDRVNHDVLMARLVRRVEDKRVLLLIRRYLQAGIMEGGVASPRSEGTPQGGPLSSAVDRPSKRKFLGYSVSVHHQPKLRIAPESIRRLKRKAQDLLRMGRGCSLTKTVKELKPVITGWTACFRLAENMKALEELDQWLRRKLRCILWRQWKKPRTRLRELVRRGLDRTRAAVSAYNGRGPWWNAGASHMNQAVPTSFLRRIGLVRFLEEHRRFAVSL